MRYSDASFLIVRKQSIDLSKQISGTIDIKGICEQLDIHKITGTKLCVRALGPNGTFKISKNNIIAIDNPIIMNVPNCDNNNEYVYYDGLRYSFWQLDDYSNGEMTVNGDGKAVCVYDNTSEYSLNVPTNAEDETSPTLKKIYERNNAMISELSEGTIVTLKIKCQREYQSLREVEKGVDENFVNRDTEYAVEEIIYVKSPSIHFYGDINDDGTVDSFDLIAYRKYLAGNSDMDLTNDMFLNADINKNDTIDADDLA